MLKCSLFNPYNPSVKITNHCFTGSSVPDYFLDGSLQQSLQEVTTPLQKIFVVNSVFFI